MGANFLSNIQEKVSDKFNEIKTRKMKQMIEEFVLPIIEPKMNDFFDLIDKLQKNDENYSLTLTYQNDYLHFHIKKVVNYQLTEATIKIERSELINLAFDEKKLNEIISQLKTITEDGNK